MILYENEATDAAFYLAAEDYIMREGKVNETVLLFWIIDDTVVIGANQVLKAEVDEAYTREAGITIARRPSGGGAIFTDKGGLQFTVILPYSENAATFDPKTCMRQWLAEPLIDTLERYGVKALHEGRNDVVIDGKKVSGLSQYVKNGYICSHGTLIFSTDLEKLVKALTVDSEKIVSKAIASVRARVTQIAEYISEKDTRAFCEALIDSYGRIEKIERKEFTEEDLKDIYKIKSERYGNDEWIYGHEPAFTFTNQKRFPGGKVEVFLDVKGGVIQNAEIKGDFLAVKPVGSIEEGIVGARHREDDLRDVLHKLDVETILGSITESELLEVLV
jgi:lipoyltransferase and lipoate-protein ligase